MDKYLPKSYYDICEEDDAIRLLRLREKQASGPLLKFDLHPIKSDEPHDSVFPKCPSWHMWIK